MRCSAASASVPGDFDLAHVADIEHAGARSDRQVLVGDAGVLDRHVPARKWHHPSAQGDMTGMKWCALESDLIGLRHGGSSGGTGIATYCAFSAGQGASDHRRSGGSLDCQLTNLIPPIVLPAGNRQADRRLMRERVEHGDSHRISACGQLARNGDRGVDPRLPAAIGGCRRRSARPCPQSRAPMCTCHTRAPRRR